VHGGYLPDYKGSTTNYYSLIVENTLGASAIFLSEEIDSGPVLLRREFPPPANRQAIDHIYDSGARAKVLVETLKNYMKCGGWEFELPANIGGETYYIIHPVLKHIAILDKGKNI
jgi:methionyl-tRNA formyltransferase